MTQVCAACATDKNSHPLPEAGSAVNKVMLNSSREQLLHMFQEHDLGSGASDCGCVVMDYQLYPCKEHSK
ncbi:MAG: hypothetical protein V4690_04250 [Patescibacteria group bacterium]